MFDTDDDGADKHNALNMVEAMNDVLRANFPNATPIIAQSSEYDCTEEIRDENIEIITPEDELTHEMCPHCENEVEIPSDFAIQECPNCKCPILPCSMCDEKNCKKCPLETPEYRSKLVQRAMEVLYAGDAPKYDGSNRTYIESLTNVQISIKLSFVLSTIHY